MFYDFPPHCSPLPSFLKFSVFSFFGDFQFSFFANSFTRPSGSGQPGQPTPGGNVTIATESGSSSSAKRAEREGSHVWMYIGIGVGVTLASGIKVGAPIGVGAIVFAGIFAVARNAPPPSGRGGASNINFVN